MTVSRLRASLHVPLALLLLGPVVLARPGDPVERWRVPLGFYAAHSTIDSQGNLLVVGGSYQTAKISPEGTLLWERSFDIPGSIEIPVWVAVDAQDNVIHGGYAQGSSGGPWGLLAVKYDPDGVFQWSALPTDRGQARRVAVDELGDVYLFGETWGGLTGLEPTGNDFLTAKVSADGTPLWARVADGTGSDEPYAMDVRGGMVVVTGHASSPFMTVAYDDSGNELWRAFYLDGIFGGTDVVIGPSGEAVVCGWGTTYGTFPYVGTVVSYDAGGAERWRVLHNRGPGALDNLRRLAIDDTGAVAATGFEGEDWATWKIDSGGQLLWARYHDGTSQPFSETGSVPVIGRDGQVYVVGKGGPSCTGIGLQGHLLRYDADGALAWSLPLECSTFAVGLDLGPTGDLYVGATGEAFRIGERGRGAPRPAMGPGPPRRR